MTKKLIGLTFLSIILVVTILFFGSLTGSPFEFFSKLSNGQEDALTIFFDLRIPRALTSFLAGASLGIAGLVMQTMFRNPLAGPFVLGIHSGSSLLVALWIIVFSQQTSGLFYDIGSVGLSIIGSIITLLGLVFISVRVRNNYFLLLFGVILSYLTSGIMTFLISIADSNLLKNFAVWGLGSFSRLTLNETFVFGFLVLLSLLVSLIFRRQMNLLLMGDDYATSTGVDIKTLKIVIIAVSGVLTGLVIAFCGPIGFAGIVAPHLARIFLNSYNHGHLLLASFFIGGSLTSLAELISGLSVSAPLPVNGILGILGAPIIILILLKTSRRVSV